MTSAATATTSRDPFSADRGIEPVPFRKLGTMPEPDPSPTPDTIAEPPSPHLQPVTAAPDRNRPVPHAIALFRALPRRRQVMIAGTAVGSLLSLFLVMGIAKRQAPPVGQEVGMISAPLPSGPKASPAPEHSPASSPSPPAAQILATDEDLKTLLAMKKPSRPAVPTPATLPTETTPAQRHDIGIENAVPTDDAVQKATRLQAAPMTSDDQLQVLQLVTEEAALVQRTRSDIAALRQDLDRLRIADTAKASDLNRRISLLEAKRAVADAEAPPSDGPAATRAAADKARAGSWKPRRPSHSQHQRRRNLQRPGQRKCARRLLLRPRYGRRTTGYLLHLPSLPWCRTMRRQPGNRHSPKSKSAPISADMVVCAPSLNAARCG
ncbi:hypothetical protein SXCC_00696 [Gluconacetobacter sp. SXCC-1]|nr:hypothetical protein SXCC_00696 [Gluconacetobacter sp. SXCC-1]